MRNRAVPRAETEPSDFLPSLKKNKWVRNKRCCCSVGIFPQAPKMSRSSGEHRPFSARQKRFLSKDRLLHFEPVILIFLTVTVILFCFSKTCTSHFCSALNRFLKETWLTITFGGGCVCGHTADEWARVTRCRLHAG